MRKKVILLVIDSFHPQVLQECLRKGWAPALKFLRDYGYYHKDCVSVFPTMTPTAAASIATGFHPDIHGVPGFIWYHAAERRIVNYGASPMAVRKLGIRGVVEDLMYNLNSHHLNQGAKTIYEILAKGGISSGCINFFIHRGHREHHPVMPLTFNLFSRFRLSKRNIKGPDFLTLGKIVRPDWLDFQAAPSAPWNKYGINDLFSGYVLTELIKKDKLPDFTLAYFPDTDAMAHDHGPLNTHKSIRRVDKKLAAALNLYSSWQEALDHLAFIIVGDHSQTLIGKSRRHLIDLQDMFADFTQLSLGKDYENEQLVISPNERMAIIDFPDENAVIREKVIKIVTGDYRISQVMWKQGDEYRVVQGGSGKKLAFKPGGDYWDRYDLGWYWYGDLKVLDMRHQDRQLVDGDYPNAFFRIKSALDSSPGGVFLSALPGYEFKGEHAPLHPGGGSHGSLHKEDSLVPLIIAGFEEDISNPRITSFVPYLRSYFGVDKAEPAKNHALHTR